MPRDVIKIPALAGGAGSVERWFLCRDCQKVFPPQELRNHENHDIVKHPTQKPLALTERLLLSVVCDGAPRVLIPFAGSGSECVVAKQMGFSFTAFEINPEYVELANGWLNQV